MHGAWLNYRSMTADPSLKEQKLKPGTVKRIFSFARPYQASIYIYLATVVIDAALIVATPLLLKKLIDDGVIPKDSSVVTQLAFFVALIAIADAAFNMLGRYFSSNSSSIILHLISSFKSLFISPSILVYIFLLRLIYFHLLH